MSFKTEHNINNQTVYIKSLTPQKERSSESKNMTQHGINSYQTNRQTDNHACSLPHTQTNKQTPTNYPLPQY